MKTGYGTYNLTTGKLVQNSNDLNCTDKFNYCSTAAWANSSWSGGKVPGMNAKPPQKDTIILPTGMCMLYVDKNPKAIISCQRTVKALINYTLNVKSYPFMIYSYKM
jgi:hypothetical protein